MCTNKPVIVIIIRISADSIRSCLSLAEKRNPEEYVSIVSTIQWEDTVNIARAVISATLGST
jgi:hypothetical protein